jgi:hypothetical protein
MAKAHGFLDVPEKVFYNGDIWEVEEIIVRNQYPFMQIKHEMEPDPEYYGEGRNPITIRILDPYNDDWYPETDATKELRQNIHDCRRKISELNDQINRHRTNCLDYDV